MGRNFESEHEDDEPDQNSEEPRAPDLPAPAGGEPGNYDELTQSIIEDFVSALDLPDSLKEALRAEALVQLKQLQKLGWWQWLFSDGPATLQAPETWAQEQRLSPEEAKQHVDTMVSKLNQYITDIRDPELTQRFQHLADELNGLSFQLASSAPVINVLRQQVSVAQAAKDDFMDLEAQLTANIMNDEGLDDDQKLSAKAELHTWNGLPTDDDGPPLSRIAPRLVKQLRLASENSAVLLAELVNSGLIQPQKFASVPIARAAQPDRSHVTAHEFLDSSRECVQLLAEMMTFIAELNAQIKALDNWTGEGKRWAG